MEPDEDAAWVEELDELEGDDWPEQLRRAAPVDEFDLVDPEGLVKGSVSVDQTRVTLAAELAPAPHAPPDRTLGFTRRLGIYSQRHGVLTARVDALVRRQAEEVLSPELSAVLQAALNDYPLREDGRAFLPGDDVELTVDQRFSFRQQLFWMFDRPDLGLEDCELFLVPSGDHEPRFAGGFGHLLRVQDIQTATVRVRLAVEPFAEAQVRLARRAGSPEGTRNAGHWYQEACTSDQETEPWLVDDHLLVCFGRIPEEIFVSVGPGGGEPEELFGPEDPEWVRTVGDGWRAEAWETFDGLFFWAQRPGDIRSFARRSGVFTDRRRLLPRDLVEGVRTEALKNAGRPLERLLLRALEEYPLAEPRLSPGARDECDLKVALDRHFLQWVWEFDRPDLGLTECPLFLLPEDRSRKTRHLHNRLAGGYRWPRRNRPADALRRRWADRALARLQRRETRTALTAGGFGEFLEARDTRTTELRLHLSADRHLGWEVRLVRKKGLPAGTPTPGTWYRAFRPNGVALSRPWIVDDHLALWFGRLPDEFYLSVRSAAP